MTAGVRRFGGLPLIAGLACLAAQPCAAASGNQGTQLAASCASCHRPDGRDTGIPPVVGLDESRIVQSMRAYRAGERTSQIMNVVAAALSAEETAAVAHYLAGQKPASER